MMNINKERSYQSELIDELLLEITQEEQEKSDKRMLLAARIDDALKNKGLRKNELAKALNKKPSEISKWLSGTHNFTIDTLIDIERILNIELLNLNSSNSWIGKGI